MWEVERVMSVRSCVSVHFWHGYGHVKDPSLGPRGKCNLSLLVHVQMLRVCAENVHHSHQMLLPKDCSSM